MRKLPEYIAALPVQQQAVWAKHVHSMSSFIEFAKEEIEQSVSERFEQQVRKFPHRRAVKTKNHAFTYDELNKSANQVAHAMLAQRGAGNEPVALLLDKDASLFAALLAVLKAGKIYVPLEPSHPPARMMHILEQTQGELVVTDSTNLALAREVNQRRCPVLNIDELDASFSVENPGLSITPDSLACILYTSGSTGQPKGVVQNHRNILHSIMRHTNILPVCPDDRLTLLSSMSFVGAVRDTFSALLNGAALFPFDLREDGVDNLAGWLSREGITMYRSVATVFRHFVSTLREDNAFPRLRVIKLGSETIYKDDVELYKRHFAPDCILFIGMGTTETGTAAQYLIDKETQITGSVVPAGYAVEDTELLVLDENGNEVGYDTVGEIAIKSRYIALGYWRRPDLTPEVFLPDPLGGDRRLYRTGDLGRLRPDGCLEHLGRKDFQVKIRGSRIEVTEVEEALFALDTVKEAAVVAQEGRRGDKRLVAYVVPTGQPVPTVSELQSHLMETLPAYMVPSVFVILDALPLTPTGKVKRKALPPVPDRTRSELKRTSTPPRTPIEHELVRIWADVLDLEQIGIHDSFLELGGHSLLATQLIARVLNTLHVAVALQVLWEAPTVAHMAVAIVQHLARQAEHEDVDRLLAEVEGLSEGEAQQRLVDEAS